MEQLFLKYKERILTLSFLLTVIACDKDNRPIIKNYDPENFELFRELPWEKSKLIFENQIIENNRINILNYLYYYNGSGVSVGDINNVGLPDI